MQTVVPPQRPTQTCPVSSLGDTHRAALRAAAESAEAASAALRADLAEEREALFAERDAAVEKNRKYYQGRRQYPRSLERI